MAKSFEKVTPESCGISSRDLMKFIEGMENMPEEKETHGFMLIRHGKLLMEGWFAPYRKDMPHMLFSDTKTFVQFAIGFMVQEGIVRVEDKISGYFTDKLPENISEHNKNLTVRHMLMMATGHKGQAIHAGGDFTDMSKDKVKEFFETENYIEAGKEFQYDNIATYVLSCLVTRLTGKNVAEFLKPRLLDPLGITVDYYSTDTEGNCIGYSGFRIKLEALAKIGQFLLDGGKWDGQQILSEEWCKTAMAKHTDCIGPCGPDWNEGYCWQMWRGRHNTARLCGAYGQMCVIAPDYDMVFATNSGANYNRLQYILDNFYENVLLKVKDEPLEEDAVGSIKLENKIEKLALQNIFAPIPPRAKDIDGREFKFEKILNYSSVKLNFTDAVCRITLSGDKTISFEAGLSSPKETYIEDGGFIPVDPKDHGIYHATAYFDKDDVFTVTARILETVTIVKIIITPEDKVEICTIRGNLD